MCHFDIRKLASILNHTNFIEIWTQIRIGSVQVHRNGKEYTMSSYHRSYHRITVTKHTEYVHQRLTRSTEYHRDVAAFVKVEVINQDYSSPTYIDTKPQLQTYCNSRSIWPRLNRSWDRLVFASHRASPGYTDTVCKLMSTQRVFACYPN